MSSISRLGTQTRENKIDLTIVRSTTRSGVLSTSCHRRSRAHSDASLRPSRVSQSARQDGRRRDGGWTPRWALFLVLLGSALAQLRHRCSEYFDDTPRMTKLRKPASCLHVIDLPVEALFPSNLMRPRMINSTNLHLIYVWTSQMPVEDKQV